MAERNPYTLRAGEDLPVRLTYENRPLAGALVVAMNRLNPCEKLIGSHRQRRPRAIPVAAGRDVADQSRAYDSGAGRRNAEWASFWASLTFELPKCERTS